MILVKNETELSQWSPPSISGKYVKNSFINMFKNTEINAKKDDKRLL